MKRILYAVALSSALCGPAFAQETPPPPNPAAGTSDPAPATESTPARESTAQEQPEAAAEASADPSLSEMDARARTKEKVRSKILEMVESALDGSEVELTAEMEGELEKEFEELEADLESIDGGRGIRLNVDTDGGGGDVPLGGILLGGLAILLVFGTPVMIVSFILYAGYRKRRLVHDVITQYLASGKEVPPDILQNLQGPAAAKNSMQKGVFWTFVGLGIISFFLILGEEGGAAIGCIPLFIGLAQLLIWKLEQRENAAKE